MSASWRACHLIRKTLGRIKIDSSALGDDADTLPLLSVGINSCFGGSLRCPSKVQLQALGKRVQSEDLPTLSLPSVQRTAASSAFAVQACACI